MNLGYRTDGLLLVLDSVPLSDAGHETYSYRRTLYLCAVGL